MTSETLGALAHRCWGALEVVHTAGYFAPEPRAAYKALGLRGRHGYFAARSAPMGPVPAQVTLATFYVFAPRLVHDALPAAWGTASPTAILDARHAGVAAVLHRVLADHSPPADVNEALDLARTACAGLSAPGRPLYAGHASLSWPADPLLALWHAATLVREHRGDGHVAALLLHRLDPVEAIITGGLAAGTTAFMKASRGWTEGEWAAGEDRLRARGLLDADGGLTGAGNALRAQVEERTKEAAMEGWIHLGADGAARLLELVRPMRKALLAANDVFPAVLSAPRRR